MSQGKFSAVLITLNEESNLEPCLAAIAQVTDDIIVIDGHSTDRTEEVAQKYHANFIKSEWLGYAKTKNFGHQHTKYEWILSIDADEVLSPDLIQNLQSLNPQKGNIYLLDRMTNFCGQWIKHCGWYPDWKMRLFHKDQARWEGDFVHETLVINAECKKVKLKGVLEHYSYRSHQEHLDRNTKYSKLVVQAWLKKGKKIGIFKRAFGPAFRFFKIYFLRLGILDGEAGYVISKHNAQSVRQKIEMFDKLNK